MPLVREGRDIISRLLTSTGAATTPGQRHYDSTGAYIFVGAATCPHTATSTWLDGTSKAGKLMDAGFPETSSSGLMRFRSTFATNEANFPWNQWLIANATVSSTGTPMNLKTEDPSLGTKPNTQTWQFTAEVQVTT